MKDKKNMSVKSGDAVAKMGSFPGAKMPAASVDLSKGYKAMPISNADFKHKAAMSGVKRKSK